MNKYTVEIVPKAEKEFLKLQGAVRNRIRQKILSLEDNPRTFGIKKLRETEYYRFRAGDFRVIYAINDKEKIVKVLSIAHRKEVYRQ
ncbi:MAG: type II toxin-antitoxin system RelE/ParE family toxin [Thermodesulfovibrionales bacterium]|nr:type II toxin-antitoxin system RelE/ParE family toxin [Thermodesulfovibrionales bacterium]